MTNAHGVARDQIRAFVERIERLEEEKKTIADDIKDVYGEAKSMGFDTKILKKVIALRKKDENERAEEEAILDAYKMALGMIPQLDMFDAETGEVFDGKASAKLVATVATGMQTEVGRAALIAAVDVMIAREEAETESPRKAAEAVSERTAINQPEMANEMDRVTEGSFETGSEAAEKGRKAIPAGPEGVDLNHAGAGESPATPIAPASHGEAEAHSVEREPTGNVASDNIRAAANTGGDHVDPDHSHAATAGTRINHIVPATAPKTARDFRPHCLKPDACGASGLDHCYSCKRAMKAQEEFA